MPLHVAEFTIPELMREVLAEVEPLIARSRLTVSAELAEELPTVGQRPAEGQADRPQSVDQRAQVHAAGLGHGGRHVATPAAEQVAIAVTDTGIGIAKKDQDVIFEDFRQADNSPTRRYTGAGLGLAICRRLATMLDGELVVQSAVGAGSTFTLTMPGERGKASDGENPASARARSCWWWTTSTTTGTSTCSSSRTRGSGWRRPRTATRRSTRPSRCGPT